MLFLLLPARIPDGMFFRNNEPSEQRVITKYMLYSFYARGKFIPLLSGIVGKGAVFSLALYLQLIPDVHVLSCFMQVPYRNAGRACGIPAGFE